MSRPEVCIDCGEPLIQPPLPKWVRRCPACYKQRGELLRLYHKIAAACLYAEVPPEAFQKGGALYFTSHTPTADVAAMVSRMQAIVDACLDCGGEIEPPALPAPGKSQKKWSRRCESCRKDRAELLRRRRRIAESRLFTHVPPEAFDADGQFYFTQHTPTSKIHEMLDQMRGVCADDDAVKEEMTAGDGFTIMRNRRWPICPKCLRRGANCRCPAAEGEENER